MITVSIICPIYNEERFIENLIQAVLHQDLSAEQWELLLVDGLSKDNTRKLIQPYIEQYSNIYLLDNPHRTVPYAMNIGILAAKGKYICRMDVHASFPTNYVSILLHYINELPDAANVGSVCHTQPRTNTLVSKSIAYALSSRFGVGNSDFRTGIEQIQECDTVPFGCFKKQTLIDVGLYDTRLTRNQDIELNQRIRETGKKIYLLPEPKCTYYPRATYGALMQNNFYTGGWNILTVYYTGNIQALSPRHFIPMIFVLSLLLPLPLCIFNPYLGIISLASLVTYLLTMTIVCTRAALKDKQHILYLALAYISLHISYGIGSICGILQLPYIHFFTSSSQNN